MCVRERRNRRLIFSFIKCHFASVGFSCIALNFHCSVMKSVLAGVGLKLTVQDLLWDLSFFFSVCESVLVSGCRVRVLGTARLSSWRQEATGDLWPEDSWSVAERGPLSVVVMGACWCKWRRRSNNRETIDVRAVVGDSVVTIPVI